MVSYFFEGNKRLWTQRDEEENDKIFSEQSQPTGVQIPTEITPIHLANAEYEVEKWPVAQIMRLLRLYGAHRCLWDVSCKDNRNRKMRQAALIDITAAMGGGLSKEQVVQKINVIRATYRYEKKRIKQRMRRGMGARTKLKWFALADAFLRKVPKKGQKSEDPCNSDSDLEDAIVFTINPESLIPIEPVVFVENSREYQESDENFIEAKQELFSDDEAGRSWEDEKSNNFSNSENSEDNKPLKEIKREILENDLQAENTKLLCGLEKKDTQGEAIDFRSSFNAKINQIQPKSSNWSLENTLEFLRLLRNYPILWNIAFKTSQSSEYLALDSIAKDIGKPIKSIEKRWNILRETYAKEKQMIVENPLYKPKYKWWSEAENLMESTKIKDCDKNSESDFIEEFMSINETDNIMDADNIMENSNPTESIFLQDTTNLESNDNDEDYEQFLQNPIPSVAPLSNMNEAMESLFHQNDTEEDFSLESNTNSSFPKETEAIQSTKFVWHGLEDDLLEGKWSLKHSVKFLRLYGVHKCLWDLNNPDYRSRPLRNAAIADIAASMGYGLTSSYVAKKIKIFRITYMQQRKRILEATEKGETPEILLKWFPLADSFLRPHIGLRSIKSDAKEMPQFDYQYVYANLNLIDPALLTDFRGKGTQNAIEIGNVSDIMEMEDEVNILRSCLRVT